ncbi:hypothetical protein [Pyrococcus kukulkanii]|uniref:Uncharacterized protein n=1 Tax=Pyrococcus kukulkanii TaxID=1609559 RepID=A0ABV4T6P8_9EURY
MEEIKVSKKDILFYERLRIISELAPIREKIRAFENKYGMTLEEFEKWLENSREESFEAWDDYIEWKAYSKKLEELQRRLEEIQNVQRVRIT